MLNLFMGSKTRSSSRENSGEAKKALDKEWMRLRKIICWREDQVREWKNVQTEAKNKGHTVLVGRIFDLCVEKRSWTAIRT